MIYAKLSTMVNSGEKIEIEERSEVGFFILCISVLFEIIRAFTSIFVELGLFFLQNSLFKYKDNKTLPCTNHPK